MVNGFFDGIVVMLTGEHIPDGSNTRMISEVALPLEELHKSLNDAQISIAGVNKRIKNSGTSLFHDSYTAAVSQSFGDGDAKDFLTDISDAAKQMAGVAREFGYQIVYTVRQIILQVAQYLVEFIILEALEKWFPALGAALIRMLNLKYGRILQLLRKRLVRAALVLVSIMAENTVMQVAIDGIARWMLAAQGFKTTQGGQYGRSAAMFGAIQGAISLPMPFLNKQFAKTFKRMEDLFGKNGGKELQIRLQKSIGPLEKEKGVTDVSSATLRKEDNFPSELEKDVAPPPYSAADTKGLDDTFSQDLSQLTSRAAETLLNGKPDRAFIDDFSASARQIFSRDLSHLVDFKAAGNMGEDWAKTLIGSFGRNSLGHDLFQALGNLPSHLPQLRNGLSHGYATALTQPTGKFSEYGMKGAVIGLSTGVQNLSEGAFNLIDSGHFTTSWETTVSGAFGTGLEVAVHHGKHAPAPTDKDFGLDKILHLLPKIGAQPDLISGDGTNSTPPHSTPYEPHSTHVPGLPPTGPTAPSRTNTLDSLFTASDSGTFHTADEDSQAGDETPSITPIRTISAPDNFDVIDHTVPHLSTQSEHRETLGTPNLNPTGTEHNSLHTTNNASARPHAPAADDSSRERAATAPADNPPHPGHVDGPPVRETSLPPQTGLADVSDSVGATALGLRPVDADAPSATRADLTMSPATQQLQRSQYDRELSSIASALRTPPGSAAHDLFTSGDTGHNSGAPSYEQTHQRLSQVADDMRLSTFEAQRSLGVDRLISLGVPRQEWQDSTDDVLAARLGNDRVALDAALSRYTDVIDRYVGSAGTDAEGSASSHSADHPGDGGTRSQVLREISAQREAQEIKARLDRLPHSLPDTATTAHGGATTLSKTSKLYGHSVVNSTDDLLTSLVRDAAIGAREGVAAGLITEVDLATPVAAAPDDSSQSVDHTPEEIAVSQPDALPEQTPRIKPEALIGSGEVTTDRWRPFGGAREAFRFETGPEGRRVVRPDGSGERTQVTYRWDLLADTRGDSEILQLTRRVHLEASDSVSPTDVEVVRTQLTSGLDRLINSRDYRLPPLGDVLSVAETGPALRMRVEFVDDPAAAHTVVQVRAGLPNSDERMDQHTWYAAAGREAFVHEFVHGSGVWDDPTGADRVGTRQLLRRADSPPANLSANQVSLMGPLTPGQDPDAVMLTDDHLSQIAAVFAPHLHRGNHHPQTASNQSLSPFTDVAPAATLINTSSSSPVNAAADMTHPPETPGFHDAHASSADHLRTSDHEQIASPFAPSFPSHSPVSRGTHLPAIPEESTAAPQATHIPIPGDAPAPYVPLTRMRWDRLVKATTVHSEAGTPTMVHLGGAENRQKFIASPAEDGHSDLVIAGGFVDPQRILPREGAIVLDRQFVTVTDLVGLLRNQIGADMFTRVRLAMPGGERLVSRLSSALNMPVFASQEGVYQAPAQAGSETEDGAPQGEGTDEKGVTAQEGQERHEPVEAAKSTVHEQARRITVDPRAHAIGVPNFALAKVDDLVQGLRALAKSEGVKISEDSLSRFAAMAVPNFRFLQSDRRAPGTTHPAAPAGMIIPLGERAEALVSLVMDNPTTTARLHAGDDPKSTDTAADKSGGLEGKLKPSPLVPARTAAAKSRHVPNVVHSNFTTGADVTSYSSPTSAARLAMGAAFGGGVAPGLGIVGSATLSHAANSSTRSVSHVSDAELGHVTDVREEHADVTYRAEWQFRVRSTKSRPSWDATTLRTVPDATITLNMPKHYLKTPDKAESIPAAEAAELNRKAGNNQPPAAETATNSHSVPTRHKATGMDGLPQLHQEIFEKLQDKKIKMRLSGAALDAMYSQVLRTENEIYQALNGGYTFLVPDKGKIARVTVHATRTGQPQLIGAPSDKDHIEEPMTAIDGTGGSHSISQSTTLEAAVTAGVATLPFVEHGLEVAAGVTAGVTATTTHGVAASRTGLLVHVDRFTGGTQAYDVPLTLKATVSFRGISVSTSDVTSRVLMRIPEVEAKEYGFPLTREIKSAEQKISEHATPPAFLSSGKGAGFSSITVTEDTARRVRSTAMDVLQREGFIANDRAKNSDEYIPDSIWRQLEVNEDIVRKSISRRMLTSYYDPIRQSGYSFKLTRPRGIGITYDHDVVVVTIKARNPASKEGVAPAPQYKGTKNDGHTVKLGMGLSSSAESSSGGVRASLSLTTRIVRRILRGGSVGVEIHASRSARQDAASVTNRPELNEHTGPMRRFGVSSTYEITFEFQHSNIFAKLRDAQFKRTFFRNRSTTKKVEDQQADVSVPVGIGSSAQENGVKRPAKSAASIPPRVLDRATVYYLDTSGLVEAATPLLKGLTGPQGSLTESIKKFTGTVLTSTHLKDILYRQYTTDLPFSSGFVKDKHVAVDIAATLTDAQFEGSLGDFTLGNIRLALAQQNTAASQSGGIRLIQGDVTLGGLLGDTGDPGVLLQGGLARSQGWDFTQSKSTSVTSGKEHLELDFERVYAFSAKVDYTVNVLKENIGKFVPDGGKSKEERQSDRQVQFLLAESEALSYYADGILPITDKQLKEALDRWARGELVLSGATVANVLLQWERRAGDQERIPQYAKALSEEHRSGSLTISDTATLENFRKAFSDVADLHSVVNDASFHEASIPFYLVQKNDETEGHRNALGHAGVQSMTMHRVVPRKAGTATEKRPTETIEQADVSTYDLVREAIDHVAPGLLTTHPEAWASNLSTRQIGRLQGAVEALQGRFGRGRDAGMWEQFLSPHGHTFQLMNPFGTFFNDFVEVNIRSTMKNPRFVDFKGKTGLENYRHAYNGSSEVSGYDTTQSMGVSTGAGDTHALGSYGQSVRQGRHFSSGQSRTYSAEETVYDWTGAYVARLDHELVVTARRINAPGRHINNQVAEFYRGQNSERSETFEVRGRGTIDLRIPRGIAEMQSLDSPVLSLPPGAARFPDIDPQTFVSAIAMDEALPQGRRLMQKMFGTDADGLGHRSMSAVVRDFIRKNGAAPGGALDRTARRLLGSRETTTPAMTSPLLTRALDQSSLMSHVMSATRSANAVDGVVLGDGLFIPGNSSNRVKLSLVGKFEKFQAIGKVEGSGAGRYEKFERGSSVSVGHDRLKPAVSTGVSGSGVVADRQTDGVLAVPVDTGSGNTSLSRLTGGTHSVSTSDNQRIESHVKSQGTSVVATLAGTFRLQARETLHNGYGPPVYSDPFHGTVTVEMHEDQAETLRRFLEGEPDSVEVPASQTPQAAISQDRTADPKQINFRDIFQEASGDLDQVAATLRNVIGPEKRGVIITVDAEEMQSSLGSLQKVSMKLNETLAVDINGQRISLCP
ncbi:hypothetical protein [Streptomyces sp. NPDC090080]|uniref:hypothetical protein n=1 Tax=Streptomyces sp. NPDC090080 TaxID=3365939 RepID=UPI00382021F0